MYRTSSRACGHSSLIYAIGLIALALPCKAADVLPKNEAQRLRTLIISTVMGPGAPTASLLEPPQSDSIFAFGDEAGRDRLLSVADSVSHGSELCKSPDRSLIKAYGSIISNAKWSQDLLTQPLRAKLEDLRSTLFAPDGKPVAQYADFLSYQKAMEDAQAELNGTPLDQQTAAQRDRLKAAKEKYAVLGEAKLWAPRNSAFRQLSRLEKNGNAESYRSNWSGEEQARSSTKFQPDPNALDNSKWTDVNLILPADASYPAWLSPPAISFRFLRTNISRPWFREELFSDDSWRYPSIVADGEGFGDIGRYAVAAIFIKDVKIRVNSVFGAKRALALLYASSRIVTLGPIPLIDATTETGPMVAAINSNNSRIEIAQTMLFGCVLRTLPVSPNPNPAYKW